MAAVVALRRPARVRAAALIGAVGLVPMERDLAQSAGKVNDTSPAGVRSKLEFLVFDPTLVTDTWVAEESRINSSPGAAEALGRVRSYLEGPIDDDLVGKEYAALGVPTILVWATQDRWVSPEVATGPPSSCRTRRSSCSSPPVTPRTTSAPRRSTRS